jgi:poly(3-hydroxybutyrate) depolymerase
MGPETCHRHMGGGEAHGERNLTHVIANGSCFEGHGNPAALRALSDASFKSAVAPVEETIKAFAAGAACPGTTARTDLPDRDRNDASRIVVERQSGCKARVQLVRVQGGGHFLPGQASARSAVRGQNRDVTTTGLVTSFFRL